MLHFFNTGNLRLLGCGEIVGEGGRSGIQCVHHGEESQRAVFETLKRRDSNGFSAAAR